MDFIALDLETTGLDPERSEIIEIGAWKFKNDLCVEKFSTLIKPKNPIPSDITKVTSITNEMVANCRSIEEVIKEFYVWCGRESFVGHNLIFDYKFLLKAGQAVGLDFSLVGKRTGWCTLKIARKELKGISHGLKDLVDYFQIMPSVENYHRAEYDAYMTKLVFDRLLYSNARYMIPDNLYIKNETVYGEVKNNETLSYT